MPQTKETLRIDSISGTGEIETIVAKPTDKGFTLIVGDKDNARKMLNILREDSPFSFVVSLDNEMASLKEVFPKDYEDKKISLKEVFSTSDLKDISTASKMELKADGFGRINITRSGGTVYVVGSTGTFSVHK